MDPLFASPKGDARLAVALWKSMAPALSSFVSAESVASIALDMAMFARLVGDIRRVSSIVDGFRSEPERV